MTTGAYIVTDIYENHVQDVPTCACLEKRAVSLFGGNVVPATTKSASKHSTNSEISYPEPLQILLVPKTL